MPDLWILAFVFRGIIGTAGDVMPLEQCQWRALDLGENFTQVVCINVQSPTCRIYVEDKSITEDITARCRNRIK